jgi:aspartate aminotransferase
VSRAVAVKEDGSAVDLSRKALSLEVSPTVAVAQKAAAMKAKGETVLDFSVGEPDQPTPAHVAAAATAALQSGKTRYTQAAGIPELRAAVAERYRTDYKLDFSAAETVITTGGKQALYLACQALLDKGDEVVIPTPYWPTFAEAVRLAGAKPVLVPTQEKEGFKVTARLIGKATTAKTKAVIVNSPCNPTGAVIDAEDLLVIGDMAQRRKFTVFYDDTYAKLIFGKGPESALPELRGSIPDRFVILGTASKTYCMTGWRIGWILGPKPLIEAAAALISHSTQCPAAFAQVGAVEALRGPQKLVHDLCSEYERRRDFIHGVVAGLPRVSCALPGGAFYVFPNVGRYLGRKAATTLELAARLLDEEKVAVVPGEGFGAPGYLRISFARAMSDLQEGARRLQAFMGRLGSD